MTPHTEFADDMVVRCTKDEDQVWCKHCGQYVDHLEKTYLVKHVGLESRKRRSMQRKKESRAANFVPGPSAKISVPPLVDSAVVEASQIHPSRNPKECIYETKATWIGHGYNDEKQ